MMHHFYGFLRQGDDDEKYAYVHMHAKSKLDQIAQANQPPVQTRDIMHINTTPSK